MTKEKVKQLVAAVAVAGTIGIGYVANVITDMQRQIVELQENSAKLSQENINLVVERDNLRALTAAQKRELQELQGKLEPVEESPVSEIVSTEGAIAEEAEVKPVSFEGGTYLGYFEATAYEVGGSTAIGVPAEPGVVAVDPSIIPLGSTIYVEFDGHPELNGTYYCADVGGAVVGNIIDVCMESGHYEFGRRGCHVYLVG